MIYTYTNINTIFNMIMCTAMLSVSRLYSSDLDTITTATYPLFFYCIVDIPFNTWDMIFHHICTLMIGYVLNVRYPGQNTEATLVLAKAFIDTEISTVFLDLMYLRCRHPMIKVSFITTFLYYRIIRLTNLLFFNPTTCYFCDQSDFICDDNTKCHIAWVTSTTSLLVLNLFWFAKILGKALK